TQMKTFNLKEKLLKAKDTATLALATGVILIDKAATEAIEAVSEVAEATKQRTQEVRRQVGEKVDNTTTVIKTKTDAVKGDAAEFGKAAKRTLATKKAPAPEAEKPAAKKPRA